MRGSQQVGKALEHKDLKTNRRQHSTNCFIFCNVEYFAECQTLPLQERKTATLCTVLPLCSTAQLCDDTLTVHEMLNIHILQNMTEHAICCTVCVMYGSLST